MSDSARAPEGQDSGGSSVRTSLAFTEEMKGFYVAGASEPHVADRGERLSFKLTITADDVERFLSEPGHLARAEGWIDAASCGGRRRIERGWFNLFVPGDGAPDRREMRYRLHFTDVQGRPRTLAGWKDVHHGPPTRIWPDTTTLYYRLYEGHLDDGEDVPALGAGMLHIRMIDFVEQMTTFRTEGPGGAAALERFGRFFLGSLWDVYGPGLHLAQV